MLDKLCGAILKFFGGLFLNILSPCLLQLFRRMLPEIFGDFKTLWTFYKHGWDNSGIFIFGLN